MNQQCSRKITIYQWQNYNKAINYYSKVIDLSKNLTQIRQCSYSIISKLQQYEKAVLYQNKALTINSKSDAMYLNKGYALQLINYLILQVIETFQRSPCVFRQGNQNKFQQLQGILIERQNQLLKLSS
ncbi:unnamed protein product [Paramecium sonneborni]|uniref:Tetratricopeptide repeat protein n=1 Tax=Paramecium sonneborni TaxID=65129 RepID=A0A8S1QZH9_9CILI|nr:unnamed protein product [Paramecium sonneborni]